MSKKKQKLVLKSKSGEEITWLEAIVRSLQIIDNAARIEDIFDVMVKEVIQEIPDTAKTPTQTIYGQIYTHSNDSNAKKSALNEILFYKELPGVWGLIETKNKKDISIQEEKFREGSLIYKKHRARERNPKVIEKAKEEFKKQHNKKFFCEACGFNFYEVYGEIGKDFIEAHHINPLAELEEETETKISDIVMLCSNCHRMIHRTKPLIKNRNNLKNLIKR